MNRSESTLPFFKRVLTFIELGRKQAIFVGLVFVSIPFLGWIGNALIAYTTLRKGAQAGAIVALWICLPAVVLGVTTDHSLWLYSVIGGSIFTYFLAWVWRLKSSLNLVLQLALVIGIGSIILAHFVNPHIAIMWEKQMTQVTAVLQSKFKFTISNPQLALFSQLATGIQVIFILFANFLSLLVARYAESVIEKRSLLKKELQEVRLDKWCEILLVAGIFSWIFHFLPGIDCLPFIIFIFILAGLSVLHSSFKIKNLSKRWLVGFYVIWGLFFIYLAGALVILSIIDSWVNIRNRLQYKNSHT